MKIFNKRVLFSLAPKNTCWWVKDSYNGSRIRCDHLFGLNRYYFRKYKHYVYIIYLGRFKIEIIWR